VTQESVSAVRLTEAQEDALARGLVARARSEGAELVGPEGLLSGLTKRVLQAAMEEELTDPEVGPVSVEVPGSGRHVRG
jgi:hypothetical protein